MMKISIRKTEIQTEVCDVLIVSAYAGVKTLSGVTESVNVALNGLLAKLIREENFKGRLGQTLLIRTDGLIAAKRVLIVGLGKKEELTLETVREATAVSFHAIREMRVKTVLSLLHGMDDERLNPREIAQAMTEALRLVSYSYDRY